MFLQEVVLTQFRNYGGKSFSFDPDVTVIVGPNTAGKTNLLEAIYLLSQGEPLRATVGEELILFGKQWARVEGWVNFEYKPPEVGVDFSVSSEVAADSVATKFEVFLEKCEGATRKVFKVDKIEKSKSDFQNKLRTVVFCPESLNLILGSPSVRRDYLDRVLSSLDYKYYRSLKEYDKIVRNRNKVLWQIKEFDVPKKRLHFWDKKLFSLGKVLFQKREHLIGLLNRELENLGWEIQLRYDPSRLREDVYGDRLAEEISRATSLWGPHRDDFLFVRPNFSEVNGSKLRDLSIYGSRGEQREAVIALFLAELAVVSQNTERQPILLLDDIFSELDQKHRKKVLQVLPRQQSLVTSAEPDLLNSGLLHSSRVIELGLEG
ncbi:MAG: DNA replication and repair protein RecF [Patescibacteria group bacterium]|nr:DNA replication and repair protein RecF [Patescibacteria group bacterium]